jgi:DNA-binding transcriptional LysR family regulator
VEILQLRYFYESARQESFAKAAEKYMVPATSVSASVKRLEKELGCALFHRSCNRISLNDNGKRLLTSLSIIFDELDQTVNSLTSATTDTREIRMLVRAMRNVITDRIIEYKTKHPHIAFKTVFDFRETNIEHYDIIIDEETNR